MEEKLIASCPLCKNPVFAIVCNEVWQWSHLDRVTCTLMDTKETKWSLWWKQRFQEYCVDVLSGAEGNRLIDVKTKDGVNIKLMSLTDDGVDIRAYEEAFGERFFWLIDCMDLSLKIDFETREKQVFDLPLFIKGLAWCQTKKPVFFDLNEANLMYFENGSSLEAGEGRVVSKEGFLRKYGK